MADFTFDIANIPQTKKYTKYLGSIGNFNMHYQAKYETPAKFLSNFYHMVKKYSELFYLLVKFILNRCSRLKAKTSNKDVGDQFCGRGINFGIIVINH